MTNDCSGNQKSGSAEFAFPMYRFGGTRAVGRVCDDRNRRSNGDRERIGFKISKMTNIRFKRDGCDVGPGDASRRDRWRDTRILRRNESTRDDRAVPDRTLAQSFHPRKLFTTKSLVMLRTAVA